jgi:ADP-ribose pyrophosphatase
MFHGSPRARRPWTTRESRIVYQNRWMRVREDVAELPDGRTTLYGVVECPLATGVLPFLDPATVVLVGQYRYVRRRFLWEMPTGAARPGESAEAAARRELAEEAGYAAGRMTRLGEFDTSKSIMDETAVVYEAEDLSPVDRDPDETEFIDVRPFAFDEALAMVQRGEIRDAMTIVALLYAARRRGR